MLQKLPKSTYLCQLILIKIFLPIPCFLLCQQKFIIIYQLIAHLILSFLINTFDPPFSLLQKCEHKFYNTHTQKYLEGRSIKQFSGDQLKYLWSHLNYLGLRVFSIVSIIQPGNSNLLPHHIPTFIYTSINSLHHSKHVPKHLDLLSILIAEKCNSKRYYSSNNNNVKENKINQLFNNQILMQFLQPKVIENECFCKQHKQPIELVILDSKLSNDQRVLCKSCSKLNPNKAEIVNYLLLKENFDRQQSERIKQYQPIIKPHIEYVENFQKVADAFKTRLVRQLDNFLWLSKDWITNLSDIAQQYSFLGELDAFIKQSQFVVDQRNTMQNIKKLNENWNIKIQKQLDRLNLQPEIKKCQDILCSLSQLVQNQEREINQEYSSHSKIQQPLKDELIYNRKDDFYQVLTQTKNFDRSYLNELLKLLRNQKITNCLEFFKNQSQLQFITSMIQNISEIDINQMNYSNDKYDQIRKELIQKISYDENIIEFLKFLVSLTSIDERFIQCGSNALNLLVEMKVDLREHSFENIRMRDTSLIGGNFVRCNFNGSEFDNVDISGVNLNQAQLFNCKWKNIKIHELNRLDGHSGRVRQSISLLMVL
ncbi:unnamed protein product, partial (macronuclear) [Paramecium tetraurelia]